MHGIYNTSKLFFVHSMKINIDKNGVLSIPGIYASPLLFPAVEHYIPPSYLKEETGFEFRVRLKAI